LDKSAGLSKQLFALVNGIISCIIERKKVIIIDSFLVCIDNRKICNISDIIDLDKTSANLRFFGHSFDKPLFSLQSRSEIGPDGSSGDSSINNSEVNSADSSEVNSIVLTTDTQHEDCIILLDRKNIE